MTTESGVGAINGRTVSARLWVVRGAAIGSAISAWALYPPWEWLDNLAALIFLVVPLGALSGAILWRVRKAPYKDGLTLAVGSGIVVLLVSGLVGWVFSLDPQTSWSLLVWIVFMGLAQAFQVGGALAAHRSLGGAAGEGALFARKRQEEPIPSDLAPFTQPLRRIRGAAIGTLALLCLSVPLQLWGDDLARILFPVLILAMSVPFVMVFWRLRKGPRRSGLCLAMGAGTILSAGLGLAVLVAVSTSGISREAVFLALAAAAQAILATRALAAYRLLPRADGGAKSLVRGFVDPLVYFGCVLLMLPSTLSMVGQHYNRPPAQAVAWLKTLHHCAEVHATSHPAQGFPARLDQLGPQGARCLEPLSPQGERSGYAFTYAPAAPEAGGRIPGYRILARPVDRGRLSQKNFFMDQSGAIRVTGEDRDATPQDSREY